MLPVPERIVRLKEELLSTADSTCLERARIYTEAYRETEGESPARRISAALCRVFDTIPIFIRPGELIVGQRSSRLGARTLYPEYSAGGLAEAYPEIAEFWENRALGGVTEAKRLESTKLAEAERAAGYSTGSDTGYGHMIADYPKVLRLGLSGIIEQCERALPAAKAAGDDEGVEFLETEISVCNAIIRWAGRYADLAEREAREESGQRRAELNEIARICRTVPGQPASTFQEALQSFWFIHIALHLEQHGWSISTGRFDQYIYPFLESDLGAQTLDAEKAWELLLSLWVKFMENVGSRIRQTTFQNMTIGGADESGRDESNELSLLCLDATAALRFNQPALSMRWHPGISPDLWKRAMATIATGIGMPAVFNDQVIVRALTEDGVERADALNYGVVGCVETSIPGKEQGLTAGGHVNLAKALELALNNGVSMITGKQIGPQTGDPSGFVTFDLFFDAYCDQIRALCDCTVDAVRVAAEAQKQLIRYPLLSALLSDCVESRRDLVFGATRYNRPGAGIFGSSNVYDSLAAVRKLVYEDQRLTIEEVADAIRGDYQGAERVLALLRSAPKFGNDHPEVDELATTVGRVHAHYLKEFRDPRNGRINCGVWPVEGHVSTGVMTAATPDGRHAGAPLVDGVGACQGADTSGPTALLKSVARLPNTDCWTTGNTFNIKFSPSDVRGDAGEKRLGDLLTTYMMMGGQQVQVNVVDAATLIEAQKHPEQYSDLVVRVAGFSAYFTQLSRDVQEEIISRNTHGI
jgi:formate C-acetyltransferase